MNMNYTSTIIHSIALADLPVSTSAAPCCYRTAVSSTRVLSFLENQPGLLRQAGDQHTSISASPEPVNSELQDDQAILTLSYLLNHASSLLGMTSIELKQYLQDGDSIIHIAEHQGIAAAQFRELLSHNISLTLKEELSSGTITHRQYEEYEMMTTAQLNVMLPNSSSVNE